MSLRQTCEQPAKVPNRGTLALWTMLGFSLAIPVAHAEKPRGLRSPHTEESRWILGLKGLYVSERADEQIERGGGLGAFFECSLIQHFLELELGVVGVDPKESAGQVAFEPLLKFSFDVTETVNPYLGAGPVLLYGLERPHLRGGGQLVAGSYFWAHPKFGFDLDVGFSLLSGAGSLAYEVTVGLGPIVRF
ncbi:MAG: hypothetical protein QM778_11985 [Myxococcales bacterium]